VDLVPGAADPFDPRDLGDAAALLADPMADWVGETRFGWGQLREPPVSVPSRR
jgi:hypothetical protein